MALTKFVRNSQDLSDDGGYKFRFNCDRCGDGWESEYVTASANLLKTALDVFQMFRPLGGLSGAADRVDRGLRGKEHDAAYEKAAQEAMLFFKKCLACGQWVCPEACWNTGVGMCEPCAPNAAESAAKAAARRREQRAVEKAGGGGMAEARALSCPACHADTGGAKFCPHCGASLVAERRCTQCKEPMQPGAKFCGECGAKS